MEIQGVSRASNFFFEIQYVCFCLRPWTLFQLFVGYVFQIHINFFCQMKDKVRSSITKVRCLVSKMDFNFRNFLRNEKNALIQFSLIGLVYAIIYQS